LYFNVDKAVGYCVKCDKTRTLFDIARHVAGINLKDIQEFIENQKVAEFRSGSFKDSMINGLLGHDKRQAEQALVEIPWPDGFRTLEEGKSSVVGKRAASYLTGRGFDLERLYELGFGYCATGFYGNRVVIPTTIDGVRVYWQARDFTGRVPLSQKILNPSTKDVAIGKSQVLFNYDDARTFNTVFVVESWGSCLATGRDAAAVNGKHISETQLRLFARMKAKKFVVMFDYGFGADSGWEAAAALNNIRETWVALLPYGDPNEVPKSVLIETKTNAVPYSKEVHIKYKVEKCIKQQSNLA
jgi:hypothetical protein